MKHINLSPENRKTAKPVALVPGGDIAALALFNKWFPIIRRTRTGFAGWANILRSAATEFSLSTINTWHSRAPHDADYIEVIREGIAASRVKKLGSLKW